MARDASPCTARRGSSSAGSTRCGRGGARPARSRADADRPGGGELPRRARRALSGRRPPPPAASARPGARRSGRSRTARRVLGGLVGRGRRARPLGPRPPELGRRAARVRGRGGSACTGRRSRPRPGSGIPGRSGAARRAGCTCFEADEPTIRAAHLRLERRGGGPQIADRRFPRGHGPLGRISPQEG